MFHEQVGWHWLRALRRRSQKDRFSWERIARLVARRLPPARIPHPHPGDRGGRDHATVVHSEKRVRSEIVRDEAYRLAMDNVFRALGRPAPRL